MRLSLPLSMLCLMLTACAGDVGEGKVRAEVASEPATPPAGPAKTVAATPAAATAVQPIDPAKSSVKAHGAKITGAHDVMFTGLKGTVQVADGAVTGLAITIDMTTLEADHPKLTKHLLSEDFFQVDAHPSAAFKSTAVVAEAGENGATHKISGDMTIRGATKQLSFPATVAMSDAGITANTEFVINRQDFGIAYPGKPDDLIQDDVVLTIALATAAK